VVLLVLGLLVLLLILVDRRVLGCLENHYLPVTQYLPVYQCLPLDPEDLVVLLVQLDQ